MTLVCTIVKNKIMTTKSNTLMAFTTVEDLTGSMELLVFPRILAECRAALQENAVVVANGRVSVKEDEAARLIVEGVQIVKKHVRATQQGQQAGIVAVEAPIHRSNVMVIDPETKQPTRVRIVEKEEARDGKVKTVRVRVAKKSGKELA